MSVLAEWFARFRTSASAALPREADRSRPEATLTKHAGRLMRMKGVLSVGIRRTDDGRPAIVLGLDSDAPEILDALPKTLDGVPVVRDKAGRISAL
jgi:hypothetical protein